MSKSKNEPKLESLHLAAPIDSSNVVVLWHKDQLKLFQPVLTDAELLNLRPLFQRAVFNTKQFLKYSFALEKVQETKFELTKIGVTVSYDTWNKIPLDDQHTIVKFVKDNFLQVYIVR